MSAGKNIAVRLELGAERDVIALGIHGSGRAKIAIFAEDDHGAATPIGTGGDAAVTLRADRWAQLAPARAPRTPVVLVQLTASPSAPAAITEVALWVGGRSRPALAEAAIADRLVTELPENARAATAVPWTASVARIAPDGGSVSAKFDVQLIGEPLLGRAFLVYELERKAHWIGAARSINGHVVRGGYRAAEKGLGGVQVEEINPAWLRRGDNSILFQPALTEDGRGYTIHNVRIVGVPRGSDPVPAPGAITPLSDGDLSTGVGGPGIHTAGLSVRADREAAFLSFYLDKPTRGTLTVSADGGWAFHKSQVNVELAGRPAGWQSVPVAGMLPFTSALRVRVHGDRENTGQVSEARVHWFPALTSQAGLTVSYPLHGECLDHKTYVRGFASGPGRLQKPRFFVDGAPMVGNIDADGSFEANVAEPAAAKGKPWSIQLEVGTEGGGHQTRAVPIDTCVEHPKGRIIGVSPPVEDVGAPYGAVVSPEKASTLSFAGATIDIPKGAVESDVRVTMRALDTGQVLPVQTEMDNVTPNGGGLRFGPHGLTFKKPVRVTLPVDAARIPAGMTGGDVVAFFFDEATRKWTQLPKVIGYPDRTVAETTHFTDFIASTIRTPDHPDAQQFNPNTMKGMKAGEPGAGITLIEPPVANSRGTASLSYPIETPPGRNGVGPHLALTYDSDRVNANGWLGIGWDLRMSSIEIDTRFGVPKYDGSEINSYSLDGAMLTPIAPPSGAPSGGQYFARRVEGAFDWIQRQGSGPTSYSWTVTDKSGTVYTYGTVAGSRLANPRTTPPTNPLMAPQGSIFRWYLEKVQDAYGNNMTITYQHDNAYPFPGPAAADSIDGVYPQTIDYTAHTSGLPANYHVQFKLDTLLTAAATRPDTAISGRPGFLEVTRRRLTDIYVRSGTTLVRQYKFLYKEQDPSQSAQQSLTDTMQKSVLWAVALWGVQDDQTSELYRHTFEYNKAPAASAMFTTQQMWGQVARTDSWLTHSADNLIGGNMTLGFGFPKVASVSGSLGADYGSSAIDVSMLNLTGQGLPDQLDAVGTLSQNNLRLVAPATNHFTIGGFGGLTAPNLGATDRPGFTAGGSISSLSSNFGAGLSYSRHVADDFTILTDINGDGFPDLASQTGNAVFAYINDGNRNFGPLQEWTGYLLDTTPFSTADRVNQAATADAFFKTDPLLRWVAPFDGTVTVNATAVKLDTTGDNVNVELYVVTPNNPVSISIPIMANDLNPHTVVSNLRPGIHAGDRIYTRTVAQGGGTSAGVKWTTSIVYDPPGNRNSSEVDPTGNSIFSFDGGADLRAAGQPNFPWRLSGDGDISVARCFHKAPTPDDVKIAYVIREKDGTVSTQMPPREKIFRAASGLASLLQSDVCFDDNVLPQAPGDFSRSIISGVKADQSIALEITSDTPIEPRSILVDPFSTSPSSTMNYTRYCRLGVCGPPQNTGSGYTIPGDPSPNFPIPANDITYGPLGVTTASPFVQTHVQRVFNSGTTATTNPIRSFAAPSTSVTFGGSVMTKAPLTEDVLVLIQGVNKLHAKVRIPAGTASGASFPVTTVACTVNTDCEQPRTCDTLFGQCTGPVTVQSGEPLFFTIYSPTVIGGNVDWSPTVNTSAVDPLLINKATQDSTFDNNAPAGTTSRDPMSGGFHQWFYGDWNESIVPFNDSLIVRVPNSTPPQNVDTVLGMLPLENVSWFCLEEGCSVVREGHWRGRGAAELSADAHNLSSYNAIPGRVGKVIAIATNQSSTGGLRVSDTWNVNLTANAAGATAGVNGGDATTQVDFFDFNGDRFPDSITHGGVLLNDGTQFGSARQPVDMAIGGATELRKILNVSLQAGSSVSGADSRLLINESQGDGDTKKISATVALAASADYGVSSTRIDFADVNGDGLPDHVKQEPGDSSLTVRLNLGYGFSNEVLWARNGTSNWQSCNNDPSDCNASVTAGWGALLQLVPDPAVALNHIPGLLAGNMPASTNTVRLQDTGTTGRTTTSLDATVLGGAGGPTYSVTRTWVDLMDVNGDGLPDQVLKVPGEQALRVKLNTGSNFAPEQSWTLPGWAASTGTNYSFLTPDSLGFSTIDGYGKNFFVKVCYLFVCFGASGFESDSSGGPSAQFEDIDGDGKVDQVMKVPNDPNVYAKLNRIGRTNLLSAVNGPLGSRFTITYTRAGNHVDLSGGPLVNMPSNQWVMYRVDRDSGPQNVAWDARTVQTFDYTDSTTGYASGYFDPVERENFGYANVKTIFPDEDVGGTSIATKYFNQNYYLRGLESGKTWYQNDTTQVLQRAIADYYSDPSEQPARTGTFFPAPVLTDTLFYEMGAAFKSHQVQRVFDTNGNLTDLYDYGDTEFADGSDDFFYHVDYNRPGANITVPSAITVRTGSVPTTGNLLAKRTAGFFPTITPKPKTVTDVIVNGKDPTTGTVRTETSSPNLTNSTWTFAYDPFGNVTTATSPERTANPSCPTCGHALQYTYDPTAQTYPVNTQLTDSDTNAQYSSSAAYDLRFGLPTRVVDVTGAKQEIDYDNYGRITSVFAPTDFDMNGGRKNPLAPTIGVSYSEGPHVPGVTETLPAWAMATHAITAPGEGSLPGDAVTPRSMRTVNFVDGLERTIQMKQDITRDDGNGNTTDGMSVSGRTIFDARGRVYQQGQPTFAAGSGGATAFQTVGMISPTSHAYDVLGRPRQEQHYDNGTVATTKISYQLGTSSQDGRPYILKITTDPLYASDPNYHYRYEYATVRGDMRFRYEPNAINGVLTGLTTAYTYDQLGRVLTVTDASQKNVTTADYDTVGNMVALTSPDAGRREWRYCLGGYVCAEQSANMGAGTASNLRIQYAYDRDRLKTITYPNTAPTPPGNPIGNPGVTFVYGNANETGSVTTGAGYKANRVKSRTDEAGTVSYDYDGLGNVASESAQLTSQIAGQTYPSYQTQYKWDNFGRLTDVTIPGTTRTAPNPPVSTPPETIRYGYDAGGAVTSAYGKTTTATFPYVIHVGYNEFGERVRIKYGNNAYSTYAYTPDTRRLKTATTYVQDPGQSSARRTQAITYIYDLVGNVRQRFQHLPYDSVTTDVVPVGGFSNQFFLYDPLNQLTHAVLYERGRLTEDFGATVDLEYDEIGNITSKSETNIGDTFDSMGNETSSYTTQNHNYTLTPTYAGTSFNPSPHAPNSISEERSGTTATRILTYDANGNLTSSVAAFTGHNIAWTDTDRIRTICNETAMGCAPFAQSLYAADGTRTHNMIIQGTSPTETLYVNQYLTVRNGTLPTKHVYVGDARVASKVETSATVSNTYWYHSDNIQSTQYVTTANQVVAQHLEYFPGGEIWREENNTQALQSAIAHATTFTGKELDPTGYYYFGARYYEPESQMWLSPDPILANYMQGAPSGGVFAPRNLGLYSYAWNNPVGVRDPSGLCVWCSLTPEGAKIAYDDSQRNPMTVGQSVAYGAGMLVGGATFGWLRGLFVGFGMGTTGATASGLAVSGAAGGVTTQAVNDIADGQMSSPKQYAEAAGVGAGSSLLLGALVAASGGMSVVPPAEPQMSLPEAADLAQTMSPRPATTAVLKTPEGTFTGVSGSGKPLHPRVQQILDSIPENQRSIYHGMCAEPQCISQALEAAVDPAGGTMRAARVRAPGNPKHGTEIPPCATCGPLKRAFGIK